MVANGLVAAYSLAQGLRCVVSMVRGNVLFNKPLAWAIFSGDQVYTNSLQSISNTQLILHNVFQWQNSNFQAKKVFSRT